MTSSLDDPPVARYLTDLLTRFARSRGTARGAGGGGAGVSRPWPTPCSRSRASGTGIRRLQSASRSRRIAPPHRRLHAVHDGRSSASTSSGSPRSSYYLHEGRRAYRFVSETARTGGRADAPLYRRLSDRFEQYAGALTYARKVYFRRTQWPPAPAPDPFLRALVGRMTSPAEPTPRPRASAPWKRSLASSASRPTSAPTRSRCSTARCTRWSSGMARWPVRCCTRWSSGPAAKAARTAARRALYRMTQAGIVVPPSPSRPREPVIGRAPTTPFARGCRASTARGSRAAWILFEGGSAGSCQLCSLILNDEAGILEAAGGSITKKRLEAELRRLREHQKLPWVETDPRSGLRARRRGPGAPRAIGHRSAARVLALAPLLHRNRRWTGPSSAPGDVDPDLLGRSAELLDLPELAGGSWIRS